MSSSSTNQTAIIFCRVSRLQNENNNSSSLPGVTSLSSQEFSICRSIETHGINIYTILKTIGSAYSKCLPQQQLIDVLNKTKNKIIYVYEPSRLSRNVIIFEKIWEICKKNKHNIYVVSSNTLYHHNNNNDYSTLIQEIRKAENESIELGRRISRSYQYKKSREPVWGQLRNEKDELVDNEHEKQISRLIFLLGNKGSNITEISNLINTVGNMKNKEKFSLVEYSNHECEDINVTSMPYGMSITNIMETLKYYDIFRRNRNWKRVEIFELCLNKNYKEYKTENKKDNRIENKEQDKIEWINIWYDPRIGLPPNVKIPPGMTLPNFPCQICIPKM